MVAPEAGAMTVHNLTTGAKFAHADTAARVTRGDKIRIGRFPHVNYGGANDQLLTRGWSRALSDAALANVAAWARSYAALYGVAI